MNLFKTFFSRISDDLKERKLMPLKILFFVHASTILVLYPYLTIHMRELGINVEETAIMSAVTPVIFFIMPPLAGMIADKIGNFRLLLAIFSSLGGLSALLLLAVPVGRVNIIYPTSVELIAKCDNGNLTLSNMQEYPCHTTIDYIKYANITLKSCGFVCGLPDDISEEEVDYLTKQQFYDVLVGTQKDIPKLIYRHSTSILEFTTSVISKSEKSTLRVLTNDPYFDKRIRKMSDSQLFFPSPNLYQLQCDTNTLNTVCNFEKSDLEYIDNNISNETRFDYTEPSKLRLSIKRFENVKENVTKSDEKINEKYWIQSLYSLRKENDVVCNSKFDKQENNVRVRVGAYQLQTCSSACASTVPRRELCSNLEHRVDVDPSLTFWSYLAVRMFIGVISGTAFAMFEGAVIAVIREQNADYGLQRVYGSIGGMISSPLSGLLIDYASRGKDYTDFRPAFYLYAVLKVVTGVLMLSIDLKFKQPAQNLLQDVVTVFKNIEMIALFMACFIMGTAWGYIESFLFWLLKDMNASSSLMGFTVTVAGVAGLPLLVFSGPIIQKLGHANVLFIGFVFYAIRLLGYSLIYNPWLCLIFEAMESVTSSLSFTAAVTYAARLSTTTTDTSVQGLLGGIYYGVGKGAGSLIGGYLMKFYGTRPTYQIFAVATLITGFIYFFFNKFYIRRRVTIADDAITEKKSPLDIECTEKSIDVAKKNVVSNNGLEARLTAKCLNDNVDGSSDSGVDNPVYSEDMQSNEKK